MEARLTSLPSTALSKAVTAAFEAAWDEGGDAKQAMLDLFHASAEQTKGDVAWMLADSAAMGPQ
jgi:hypothetical protein